MSKGRNHLSHIQRRAGFANDYERAEDARRLPQRSLDAETVEGDPERNKRFKKSGGAGPISRKPHVDVLFSSSYVTAWAELKKLQDKAEDEFGPGLTEEEFRRYVKLVDAVTKLVREEREQQKQEQYDSMTPEELIALAEEAKEVLEE